MLRWRAVKAAPTAAGSEGHCAVWTTPNNIFWSAIGTVVEKRRWRNEDRFKKEGAESGVSEYVVDFTWDEDGKPFKSRAILPSFALVREADWLDWYKSWERVLKESWTARNGQQKGARVYTTKDFFDEDGKVEVSWFQFQIQFQFHTLVSVLVVGSVSNFVPLFRSWQLGPRASCSRSRSETMTPTAAPRSFSATSMATSRSTRGRRSPPTARTSPTTQTGPKRHDPRSTCA